MSKGTNNPPVVITDPSSPKRAIPSYDLAGGTPSKTGRTVAGIDEMDLPDESPERRLQREEELEADDDYEVELPDADDEPEDEPELDDEGEELSDETFDKALEAGIPYSELKDMNEEEVTKLLRQKYLDEPAVEPESKTVKTEETIAPSVPGSLEEMLAKLDFDPEEWGETTVEAMKPVKAVVSAIADELKGMRQERDDMIRAQVSTKYTNDMDGLFNRLDNKEFGNGNYSDSDHGLSARQVRARKVVATEAAKLIAKEVPMEDAFELAVKKITGDEVSVRGKVQTPKSKRKDRIQPGTSRGKTAKPELDDEKDDARREAEAAEHINEFCKNLGVSPY